MTTTCGLCDRPLTTSAYLCTGCTVTTRDRLLALPGYYQLLGLELAPSMAVSFEPRVSGGGSEIPLPLNEHVLELRAGSGVVELLEVWRAALHAELGWTRPAGAGTVEERIRAAVAGLADNLLWIASSWCEAGPFAEAVRITHRDVQSIVAPRRPARRLGHCIASVGGVLCGAEILLPESATVARCRWCGATYGADTWMALLTAESARREQSAEVSTAV